MNVHAEPNREEGQCKRVPSRLSEVRVSEYFQKQMVLVLPRDKKARNILSGNLSFEYEHKQDAVIWVS